MSNSHALFPWVTEEYPVEVLQKILIAREYLAIQSPTGYFGAATEKAVTTLQKDKGLEQVGVVGPKTRTLLNTCTSASLNNIRGVEDQSLIEMLQTQVTSLLKKIAELTTSRDQAAAAAASQ